MTIINLCQELQGRGARFERFRDMVNAQLKPQVDGIQADQSNVGLVGVRLAQLSQEHNQYTEDMGTSNARLREAQEDLLKEVRVFKVWVPDGGLQCFGGCV